MPVSYWSTTMEPHETAAEAEVGARLGFTNHKLKARASDVVETVRLIKEAVGPDYTVGLDPNMGFKYVHIAAHLAEQLEPFGTVANFEDPVLTNNLDWYRLLREKTPHPPSTALGTSRGSAGSAEGRVRRLPELGRTCSTGTQIGCVG